MKHRFNSKQKAILSVDVPEEQNKPQPIRRGLIPPLGFIDYLPRRIQASAFLDSIFCCGFECNSLNSVGAGGHWNTDNCAVSTTQSRYGGYSLKATTGPTQTSFAQCRPGAFAIYTYQIARVYVYFEVLPDATTYIITNGFGSSTLLNGVIFDVSDSKLYVANNLPGEGPYATSGVGVAVTTGQWYRVDTYADQTDGAFLFKAQVNGVSIGQVTTSPSLGPFGQPGPYTIGSRIQATATIYFDDVVISQNPGAYPIGDGYVLPFVPTSDGSHNILADGNFLNQSGSVINNATTNSYQYVDDYPGPGLTPVDTTYINYALDAGGGTEYVEHNFGAAYTAATAAPRCIESIVSYRQAGTGTGNSTFKLVDSGTENEIIALNAAGVSTFNKYSRKHYQKAPADDSDWTLARLNALKVRFGYSTDANPDQYYQLAMLEAEFEGTP